MIAPALAAGRFAAACLIGMALGLIYGFLRPLRSRLTFLADSLFLLALAAGWVYLSFGICRGDLRLGYSAGLALGGIFWERTAGRLLRPVFSAFWRHIRKILGIFWRPCQLFLNFFGKNGKKLLASWKKRVTIKNNQRKGGRRHAKADRACQTGAPGLSPQQPTDQGRGSVRYRTVYGGASDLTSDH